MSRTAGRPRRRAVRAPRPPQRAGRRRGDRGLVTLEWLLLVGAVAGLAAYSVLAVQRVLDDTSEVPADPAVRLIDADIAAALIAAEAQAALDASGSPPYDDAPFSSRCDPGIETAFDDVVVSAVWTDPRGPDGVPGSPDDVKAKCAVTPRQNLRGP